MKPSALFTLFMCFFLFSFNSCKNCDCEPEPQEPDESAIDYSLNQPDNPDRFSLAGKTYIYETTYYKSPAEDNYWAEVYHFESEFEGTFIATPNRDLTPHPRYEYLVEPFTYYLKYPEGFFNQHDYAGITFLDTLSFTNLEVFTFSFYP